MVPMSLAWEEQLPKGPCQLNHVQHALHPAAQIKNNGSVVTTR
jgi:hypothetical protein